MTSTSKTREEAWALLNEYTKSESLIKHALSVEAAMGWYAQHFFARTGGVLHANQGHYDESLGDPLLWSITGLLHDFDYEQYPNASQDGHPFVGCAILSDLNYPDVMIEAILGHATYSGVPRRSLMAKTLFACDELCGLITACVLVRPDKSINELQESSVRKKMKDKAFAKGVNRYDILLGAEELQLDLSQHIQNTITAMRDAAVELGLNGIVRNIS